MKDKELHRQKMQARLDLWNAELDRLKAKAAMASAGTQLEMQKQIEQLERGIEDGRAKLSKLVTAGEEDWASAREEVESSWNMLESAIRDAAGKFLKK